MEGYHRLSEEKIQQNLLIYEKLRIQFEKNSGLERRMKALKRLSIYYSLEKLKLAQLPLFKQMIVIANALMLNEIEIAYWELINQEI